MHTAIKKGVRTEYGHTFVWYEQPGCWFSTSGQPVMVAPPTKPHQNWLVVTLMPGGKPKPYEIRGEGAEARAFAVAQATAGKDA